MFQRICDFWSDYCGVIGIPGLFLACGLMIYGFHYFDQRDTVTLDGDVEVTVIGRYYNERSSEGLFHASTELRDTHNTLRPHFTVANGGDKMVEVKIEVCEHDCKLIADFDGDTVLLRPGEDFEFEVQAKTVRWRCWVKPTVKEATLSGEQVRAAAAIVFAKQWSGYGQDPGLPGWKLPITQGEIMSERAHVVANPELVIFNLKRRFTEMVVADLREDGRDPDDPVERALWYENNNFGHCLFQIEIMEVLGDKWKDFDFDGKLDWYHGDDIREEFSEYLFDFAGFDRRYGHW